MMDYTFSGKSDSEVDPDEVKTRAKWICELDNSEKEYRGWLKENERILENYTNGRKPDKIPEKGDSPVTYNVTWMTHQTAKEAIYARTPNTLPTLRQGHETVTTKAGQVMAKRLIDYFIKNPEADFDYNMRSCRDDFMLLGQGQAWALYEPTNKTEYVTVSEEAEDKDDLYEDEETGETYTQESYLEGEDVKILYVDWKDYRQEPAKKWGEVGWVARRVRLDKDEVKETFGDAIASAIVYGEPKEEPTTDLEEYKAQKNRVCEVWEIWSKRDKKVYFISEQYKNGPLKEQDPPCDFKNFFPCPRPLLDTTVNHSMVPIADSSILNYVINAIDNVTTRIGNITSALKVFGIYDKSITELKDLFTNDENYLHASNNWTKFLENGKFAGAIEFFPIGEYVTTLQELNAERDRLKNDYYQLSGYNSVMQGEAVANESAAVRQARSRFTDLRLSSRQKEMQRFCRDCISLLGEVIFKKFEPETIKTISGISVEDNEEFTEEVINDGIEFLKNEIARSLALEIETDSTLAINGEAEKQDRLEFMNAAINSINTAVNVSETLPEFMDPATKLLTFTLGAFPASQPLEMSIQSSLDAYKLRKEQEAQQPPQIPIEIQQMQMKQQIAQAQLQQDGQKFMQEAQQAMQDSQMKFQIKQQELQFEYQKLQIETNNQMQKLSAEMQLQNEKIQGELMLLREKLFTEAQVKSQGNQLQAQVKSQDNMTMAQIRQQDNLMKTQTKVEEIRTSAQLRTQELALQQQAEARKQAMEDRNKQITTMLDAQIRQQEVSKPEINLPSEANPVNVTVNVDAEDKKE